MDNPDPELFNRIKDLEAKSRIQKSSEGGLLLGFGPSPGNIVSSIAGTAGRTVNKFKTPADITRKIMNTPGEVMESFANRMIQQNNLTKKRIGEDLLKALNSADKKDRLIWSLSRQPAFRQMIEEEGLDILDIDRDTANKQFLPIEQLQQETQQNSPVDKNKLKEELLNRFRNR
jgi:hypothetical protein